MALAPVRPTVARLGGPRHQGLVALPGGEFLMGSGGPEANPHDGEGPVRPVRVRPFRLAARAVTNAEFAEFVNATGYRTEAERFGWSFVFDRFLSPELLAGVTGRVAAAPWWCAVPGACWRHPEGPGSRIKQRMDHPVVHTSWNDAMAYCHWAGLRLPSEAEWEFAARGGLVQAIFPWGQDLTPGGEHRSNVWQGRFPDLDTGEDGFRGTAPVDAFAPNGYGLYNMTGNVWEFCADWWSATRAGSGAAGPTSAVGEGQAAGGPTSAVEGQAAGGPTSAAAGQAAGPTSAAEGQAAGPTSAVEGQAAGPTSAAAGPASGSAKVMRGGSYLCHASYCNRYRVAARSSNTPDSSTGNLGFRCAADA